jgi:hypothetical protein
MTIKSEAEIKTGFSFLSQEGISSFSPLKALQDVPSRFQCAA